MEMTLAEAGEDPLQTSANTSEADRVSIERYHEQPAVLPRELRKQLEALWQGAAVQLYAFTDLDANLRFVESWLVLSRTSIGQARKLPNGEWAIIWHARSSVRSLREAPALSLTRLSVMGDDPDAPLLVARYSHRQKRAVGNLVFCLEQDIKALRAGETAPNFNSADRFREKTAEEIYGDAVLAPIREAQASVTVNKLAVIWRLLAYLGPYRKKVALGFTGAIAMTLVSLLPPYLTGRLIDQVIHPFESGQLASEQAFEIGRWTLLSLAVVYVLKEFFAWVRLRQMSVIGEYVASDLRASVYNHLHQLSISYFSSKQTGSIINRVSSDTDRIWDFIAFGVVEVTTSILMLTGLGAVLLVLDWRLGLLVTIPIPIVLGAIFLHGQRMQGLFLRAWRKWSRLTDCLSDTIPGVRVVKAFNREKYETDKFAACNEDSQ